MNDQPSPGGNADPTLRRQLLRLRVAVLGLAIAWAVTVAWLMLRDPSLPPVVSVERLEVVEPDGTPALVVSNSERPAIATIDGQVLLEDQADERRGYPSIIFFDGKGDEVGGMMFGVRETEEGYSAVRHLSFDAYGQDQTVVLSHTQDPEGSRAGLSVSDRPADVSILDAFGELGLDPGATRAELTAAIEALPEEGQEARLRELFGTGRLFLGSSREGEASLVLRDGRGRPRLVVEAPGEGDPSIRFLDGEGETVLRIPEAGSGASDG